MKTKCNLFSRWLLYIFSPLKEDIFHVLVIEDVAIPPASARAVSQFDSSWVQRVFLRPFGSDGTSWSQCLLECSDGFRLLAPAMWEQPSYLEECNNLILKLNRVTQDQHNNHFPSSKSDLFERNKNGKCIKLLGKTAWQDIHIFLYKPTTAHHTDLSELIKTHFFFISLPLLAPVLHLLHRHCHCHRPAAESSLLTIRSYTFSCNIFAHILVIIIIFLFFMFRTQNDMAWPAQHIHTYGRFDKEEGKTETK